MKTELITISPTRKEIGIEIEPEVVQEALVRISDRFVKSATVPGFRPGHAPASVVRTRFKNQIQSELLRELVPDAVNEAIDKHNLQTVGDPHIHLENEKLLAQVGHGPIAFQVNVEVLPTIELGKYKELELVRRTRQVTEQDIDKRIEQIRELSASLQPVEDRDAEKGDHLTVNMEGKFVDSPSEEDIKINDVEIVLGEPGLPAEFDENLTGLRVDDQKTFIVDYPWDFSSQRLAGKKVEYKASVSAVRMKELPEVDDEWVKSLGDEKLDSVIALKDQVKTDLESLAEMSAEQSVRNELVVQLLESHQFEVPSSLVDMRSGYLLQEFARDLSNRRVSLDEANINWEELRETFKKRAEEDVRQQLLFTRIADEEKINVSEEDVEAEIEAIAAASGQPIEQVRGVLTKDGAERSIANRIRNKKTFDLLLENAHVTEEKVDE